MLIFVLIIGLFFLAVAVTMVMRAVGTPGGRSSETLDQIDAYGFAGTLPAGSSDDQVGFKERMDSLSGAIGRWAASRFTRFKLPDYRARLVSAGMYNASPERLLGMQFLTAVAFTFGVVHPRGSRRHARLDPHLRRDRRGDLRLDRPRVRRRPQGAQAPRPDREGPART